MEKQLTHSEEYVMTLTLKTDERPRVVLEILEEAEFEVLSCSSYQRLVEGGK